MRPCGSVSSRCCSPQVRSEWLRRISQCSQKTICGATVHPREAREYLATAAASRHARITRVSPGISRFHLIVPALVA